MTACSSGNGGGDTPAAQPGSAPQSAAAADLGEEGLKAAGSGWDQVWHIIITHHHPDHAGGLTGLSADAKGTFYAGEGDVASIVTDHTLKPVKDGDEVFGLQIIGTPGHTPGHIAVFDPRLGVLVAGDALNTQNGPRTPPRSCASWAPPSADAPVSNRQGFRSDGSVPRHRQ